MNYSNLIIGVGIILVIGSSLYALSSQEYRNLIVRSINPYSGLHRLNFDDIFENENRIKIINIILVEPGIHFNEIKRQLNLQTGQLDWHIKLLESYGVIQVRKIGQYNTYFPTISDNPFSDLDIKLIKSKTTLKVMQIIKEIPGITASQIAKSFKLGRNTIKYHVDKLAEKKMISSTKEGRKLKLYFNLEMETKKIILEK